MSKKRIKKQILNAAMLIPLLLISGCGTAEESISVKPPSPTATETPIPLPTATVEPTITPVPAIPDEFTNQIDHQETLNDGRVVAIDDTGKRILQIDQETKEWISYQRQIGVVKENFIGEILVPSMTGEMKESLPEEEIHRIHDDQGNIIPFGYLPQYKEEYQFDKGPVYHEYFSGIVRGCLEKDEFSFLVVEFPNKNGDSQYLLVLLSGRSTKRNFDRKKFYDGNIDNWEGGLSDKIIAEGLKRPEAVGYQIVFSLQDEDGREIPGDDDNKIKFGKAQDKLFEMIKKGQIYDEEDGYAGITSRFYIPAELIR